MRLCVQAEELVSNIPIMLLFISLKDVCVELCPGCAVLCSARAPNRRAFGIYVRRNLVLNIIQVVLGIVQFAVSLGALNKDCSDETVYTGMAVGIILAIESGIEIVVWVGCYGLYWYAC